MINKENSIKELGFYNLQVDNESKDILQKEIDKSNNRNILKLLKSLKEQRKKQLEALQVADISTSTLLE